MADQPVVIAGFLLGYEAFLAARHIDAAALYAKAGLSAYDLSNPQSEIPVQAAAEVWEEAARISGEPCLALDWAERFPVGGTGALFYLFLNSQTIGEGLRTVAQYAPLLRRAVDMHFDEDKVGATLWWRWPDGFSGPYTQVSAFGAALFVARMRLVTSATWTPVSVELQGEPLQCDKRVRWLLGPNVTYRANRNAVRIDLETSRKPIAQADPRLRQAVQTVTSHIVQNAPAGSAYVSEVRSIIHTLLADRKASLEGVAHALGCSPRTLQNRLAQASTSFENLLNDIRRSRAEQMLRQGDLSMSSISNELGFSELSAFTRAAQRWFGMAPSAYRKRLKT